MLEVWTELDPHAHRRGHDVIGEARLYLARLLEARGADITQIKFTTEDHFAHNTKIMRATAPENAYPKAPMALPPVLPWGLQPPAPPAFAALIQNLDAQRHALMPAQAAKTKGLKPAQLRMVIRYLEAVLGAMKP